MRYAHTPSHIVRYLSAALLVLAVAACGTSGPQEYAVTATDFAFTGIPDTVAVGSTVTLSNESNVELHEWVAIPLPTTETRTAEEIIADPEGLRAYFPVVDAVLIAPPGADGMPIVGTGELSTAGRYLIICAIPTGVNPDEYLAAAAETEGGPPDVGDGPPHFVHGMWTEITVEN